MADRLFAIFDIHGRSDLLKALLKKLVEQEKLDLSRDQVIFMGDFIDRGPDSKGVVETVMELHKLHSDRVICLRGNHEQMCLDALFNHTSHGLEDWVFPGNGGGETLRSYDLPEGVPEEHLEWMSKLLLSYEIPGFFFSHAPILKEHRRRLMLQGQPLSPDDFLWSYPEGNELHNTRVFDPQSDGKPTIGVCGHVVSMSHNKGHVPRLYPHYIFGDTGCGKYDKAPLCAIEVNTRQIVYAWPKGTPGYRADHPEQYAIK